MEMRSLAARLGWTYSPEVDSVSDYRVQDRLSKQWGEG